MVGLEVFLRVQLKNCRDIEERKNELIRPIVANVDNLLIVMTISTPSINLLTAKTIFIS